MKHHIIKQWTLFFAFVMLLQIASAASDPLGVLIKPIPDKVVVVTFDDGPASLYTVVAPILKAHGFNGSFYVCDFDSFKTRKDWYMTFRQMKEMADQGFEIGNHSVGHSSGFDAMMRMEDELVANNVPKPTTIAWPVHQANVKSFADLATNGYIFARGGHNRPYRPTVDNPFEIPSMWCNNLEGFVKMVRQAAGGKVVAICYHGVPDMEHPGVSLDPEVFKAQMQYLKDNHYKVIALRDLPEYIDPVKAAKLPPTSREYKDTEAVVLAAEEKLCASVQVSKPQAKVEKNKPSGKAMEKPSAPAGSEKPIDSNGAKVLSIDKNKDVTLEDVITGPGALIKNGEGRVRVTNGKNTYSGGTVINEGTLMMFTANECLGTGPITVNDDGILWLEHVTVMNPLILNGGTIHAQNGFGNTWNGPITLNGNTIITSYADFMMSGNMSGPGGFTRFGGLGAFGPSNSGQVTLAGVNTYAGATIVKLGTLRILKAASLYNGDTAKWTPDRITVANTATLLLSIGGPGEFTGEQINGFLKNLTTTIDNNGLMGGATLCLDTAHSKDPIAVSIDIADSKGPGGGAFRIKKCGAGVLQLSGKNTYTGQTILEAGGLSVASLNSFGNGKPSGSLGAPKDIEAGEIVMGEEGKDCECALIYTGMGENTERVMNLAGKKMTLTFDHSGTGLLKLTSSFLISGYGANKTIILKGDTKGTGELAGAITNPHDRAKKATTAVTKSGSGTWTLSGINTYTGPTTVNQGTLVIDQARSLPANTEVCIAVGATLELNFKGEVKTTKLTLDGKLQSPGLYNATNASGFIKGTGVLHVYSLQ
jgi:autotransporter-associated beta strand protein